MILGIGTDIIELARVRKGMERFGAGWTRRVLHEDELPLVPDNEARTAFLAGRWAAKEACAKALGTGFALGIGPSHIRIFNDPMGRPCIEPIGPAKERFAFLGVRRAHVSISHDRESAVAFVVLEGD